MQFLFANVRAENYKKYCDFNFKTYGHRKSKKYSNLHFKSRGLLIIKKYYDFNFKTYDRKNPKKYYDFNFKSRRRKNPKKFWNFHFKSGRIEKDYHLHFYLTIVWLFDTIGYTLKGQVNSFLGIYIFFPKFFIYIFEGEAFWICRFFIVFMRELTNIYFKEELCF